MRRIGVARSREKRAMHSRDASPTRANRSRSSGSGIGPEDWQAGGVGRQKKKRRESTGGGSRRNGARTALLLVASPLQELSLLVLSHLLAALLDHTTHWNLPGPRGLRRAGFEVSSDCPHRTRSSGCFEAGVRARGRLEACARRVKRIQARGPDREEDGPPRAFGIRRRAGDRRRYCGRFRASG